MATKIYKYRFNESVTGQELQDTLELAQLAAAAIVHGPCRALEARRFNLDKANRICVIDASTDAGDDFGRIFTALAIREYGERSMKVERLIAKKSRK